MISRFKLRVSSLLTPVTRLLSSLGIKPNHISGIALFSGFFSAFLILSGDVLLASLFLLLSGFFDAVDGALARNEGLKSEFGGFLDSVLDRYVDIAIIISAGIYSKQILLASIAMAGALLVSYTRARAENVIEKCDVGIAERGERMLIILIGLLTSHIYEALIVIAILSHLTALHRIAYTYFQSK